MKNELQITSNEDEKYLCSLCEIEYTDDSFCVTCQNQLFEDNIASLEQNQHSLYSEKEVNEDVINYSNEGVHRVESIIGEMNRIDNDESSIDGLEYFIENKSEMQEHFYEELIKIIGNEKVREFYQIIKCWYNITYLTHSSIKVTLDKRFD